MLEKKKQRSRKSQKKQRITQSQQHRKMRGCKRKSKKRGITMTKEEYDRRGVQGEKGKAKGMERVKKWGMCGGRKKQTKVKYNSKTRSKERVCKRAARIHKRI